MDKKESEIPFGAFDSELMHQEINIPEGFEATIDGNKIILKKTESDDKKIEDEEYNGEDYGIDGLWHAMNILEKTLGKVSGYQTDDGFLSHQCAITAVKKLYKQKASKWSEEDENRINHLIAYFEDKELFTAEDDIAYANWLKSLKDRVQPKQEWNEYDEDMRYKATAVINKLCAEGKEYVWSVNTLKQLFYWLKSLKPQNTWKPTDLQLECLSDAIERYNSEGHPASTLKELLEQLKQIG